MYVFFLVHARSLCIRSAPVSYSIIERNDSGSFHIESTTGVFKLRFHVLLNSTFQFLVEARLQNAEHPINNATALVLLQVVARDTLNSRTIVNFKTEKLGFLQEERISNRAQQFGFFVNGYPESGGSLQAFVGEVSTEVNYTTAREQAMHVKAVLVNSDVYWDRPVVRVIAQVQDPSYNVRTLVDDSEVVVKVIPSANLSMIDGRLLQVSKSFVLQTVIFNDLLNWSNLIVDEWLSFIHFDPRLVVSTCFLLSTFLHVKLLLFVLYVYDIAMHWLTD